MTSSTRRPRTRTPARTPAGAPARPTRAARAARTARSPPSLPSPPPTPAATAAASLAALVAAASRAADARYECGPLRKRPRGAAPAVEKRERKKASAYRSRFKREAYDALLKACVETGEAKVRDLRSVAEDIKAEGDRLRFEVLRLQNRALETQLRRSEERGHVRDGGRGDWALGWAKQPWDAPQAPPVRLPAPRTVVVKDYPMSPVSFHMVRDTAYSVPPAPVLAPIASYAPPRATPISSPFSVSHASTLENFGDDRATTPMKSYSSSEPGGPSSAQSNFSAPAAVAPWSDGSAFEKLMYEYGGKCDAAVPAQNYYRQDPVAPISFSDFLDDGSLAIPSA